MGQKTLCERPCYALKSIDGIVFKFDLSAKTRWDLFEDILELDPNMKRFDTIDVQWNSDIVEKFQALDNLINVVSSDTCRIFERKPLLYSELEQIARYMSPVSCYWELFCWRPELDQMPDFGYDYKVRLGREARQHAMPIWFVLGPNAQKCLSPFTLHNNFNLANDPIYQGNVEFSKEIVNVLLKENLKYGDVVTAMMNSDDVTTDSYNLLDIEWLNLATYIAYAAWVQNSYKHDELPIRFIDWTWCGRWRDIGENYSKLVLTDCTKHNLVFNKRISTHTTYVLAGSFPPLTPSSASYQQGATLKLSPEDKIFVYNLVAKTHSAAKSLKQVRLFSGVTSDRSYDMLCAVGLTYFAPKMYRDSYFRTFDMDPFTLLYKLENEAITFKYVIYEEIYPRDCAEIYAEFNDKFGADAVLAIKSILKCYAKMVSDEHILRMKSVNTFCELN
jgi:hypothetical protein